VAARPVVAQRKWLRWPPTRAHTSCARPAARGPGPKKGQAESLGRLLRQRGGPAPRHIAAAVTARQQHSGIRLRGLAPSAAGGGFGNGQGRCRSELGSKHAASERRLCNSAAGPPARAGSAPPLRACTTRTRGLARQGRKPRCRRRLLRRLQGCGRQARDARPGLGAKRAIRSSAGAPGKACRPVTSLAQTGAQRKAGASWRVRTATPSRARLTAKRKRLPDPQPAR